jgi:DMSO/TMAO reductase YedYZ heme-binding membrane subunit
MGQTLWFASRACGMVSLTLLTGTSVLGALHTGRAATAAWPRFVLHGLHRNLALLSVVFVAVHVATAIIDPYAGIHWIDAVVPFASRYHPFWTGLGAAALDLVAALVVSSLVRTRLPLALWQRLHRVAYGLLPLALAHGLGIGGNDSGLGWVRALDVACALAVAAALASRLRARHPDTEARRALEPR